MLRTLFILPKYPQNRYSGFYLHYCVYLFTFLIFTRSTITKNKTKTKSKKKNIYSCAAHLDKMCCTLNFASDKKRRKEEWK